MVTTLVVHAATREGEGWADQVGGVRAIGVGKTVAATNLTRALLELRPRRVVLVGVCGAYPRTHLRAGLDALEVGERCLVGRDCFADEGVLTPDGFVDLGALGLGRGVEPIAADVDGTRSFAEALGCPVVAGATVSTCSGLDALSRAHALRTSAQVETMEGAAVASVCAAFEVPLVHLRVVSNRTGDRARGGWDLDGALAVLARSMGELLAAGLLR